MTSSLRLGRYPNAAVSDSVRRRMSLCNRSLHVAGVGLGVGVEKPKFTSIWKLHSPERRHADSVYFIFIHRLATVATHLEYLGIGSVPGRLSSTATALIVATDLK